MALENYRVELISFGSARPFLRRWHYDKYQNVQCKHAFGLFRPGPFGVQEMIGACVYTRPSGPTAGKTYCPDEPGKVIELRRLACIDDTPKNTESFFVSKTLRWLKQNTDPRFYWLTNYLETILSQVWFPTTVATLSHEIRKIIDSYLIETGDLAGAPFKLHDFGFRGVSSVESAAIGGATHLVNFMGTDTMAAYELAYDFYGEEMAGFSIPATEHSVMSALGEWGEKSQMGRFLSTFGQNPKFPAIACVSDTYNIYRACEQYWGNGLKEKVLNLKNMLVVRPDSGIPHVVVVQVIETLDKAFGHSTNNKGFKVLNNVRVIQGDGIDYEEIQRILSAMKVRGWSTDNIAFGMGGALLQKLNRDTQKFAFKASSIRIGDSEVPISKNPITDPGKRSKAGRLKLVKNDDGVFETVNELDSRPDILQTVFENGMMLRYQLFSGIRKNVTR